MDNKLGMWLLGALFTISMAMTGIIFTMHTSTEEGRDLRIERAIDALTSAINGLTKETTKSAVQQKYLERRLDDCCRRAHADTEDYVGDDG